MPNELKRQLLLTGRCLILVACVLMSANAAAGAEAVLADNGAARMPIVLHPDATDKQRDVAAYKTRFPWPTRMQPEVDWSTMGAASGAFSEPLP